MNTSLADHKFQWRLGLELWLVLSHIFHRLCQSHFQKKLPLLLMIHPLEVIYSKFEANQYFLLGNLSHHRSMKN